MLDLNKKNLVNYLNNIIELYNEGKATELSYYPTLKNFFDEIINNENYKVIVNPSEEWGMPDLVIQNREITVGYIECKTPDIEIKSIMDSEQIKRYVKAFPNLIITNFREFILHQSDQKQDRIELITLERIKKSEIIKEDYIYDEKLTILLNKFLLYKSPKIKSIKLLTKRLSRLTRLMDYILEQYYNPNNKNFNVPVLQNLFEGFKKTLIDNIKGKEFCDVLAQTLSYSLLLAIEKKSKSDKNQKNLTLASAWHDIPKSLPVLIELYTQFMIKMPIDIELCCNSIIQLLNNSDLEHIFSGFGEKEEDPTVYFYEKFLESYNPKLRKKKGIYYTPIPVVKFIVNSINQILGNRFEILEGFLNENVEVLDPCAGTLTFIIETIKLIYKILKNEGNLGLFEPIVKEHILNHFYAFEILVAPYAIAHFKVREIIKNLGVQMSDEESFKLYLTNALETRIHDKIPGFPALIKEYELANDVKLHANILVIFGNPPYKIGSTNKTTLINDIIKDYQPKPLNNQRENLEPLSDDYIKFIRFAQWKIVERSKEGIVAFITNNNFLRGRIHRKMRLNILKDFDEILIYDLHGDSREERPPEGKKNENIFGIRTGVCIFFFIKYKNQKNDNKKLAKIFYGDIWGNRKKKLDSLLKNNIIELLNSKKKYKLKEIKPSKPYYFFYPFSLTEKAQDLWNNYLTIRGDLFYKANLATQTSRDSLVVDINNNNLITRFTNIKNSKLSTDKLIKKNNWDKWKGDDWTKTRIEEYLQKLRESKKSIADYVRKFHYRPFDFQYLFYFKGFVQVPAKKRAAHLKESNPEEFGLVVGRSGRPTKYPWDMALMTSILPDALLVSSRGSSILCSLRYHPKKNTKLTYNLKKEFLNKFIKIYNIPIANDLDRGDVASSIMYYLYAILYSSTYRERWAEFLEYDMPRFPFPKNYSLFKNISERGKRLAKLHMFDDKTIHSLNSDILGRFPSFGSNKIDIIKYDKEKKIIKINNSQLFENVSNNVWNFRIGGYQVLKQWLRRRRNRELKTQDIKHFTIMIGIINETLTFMKEINPFYLKVEKYFIEADKFKISLKDF